MTILKQPANMVFFTDNPDRSESGLLYELLTPLHHTHTSSDWEYLHRYFPNGHIIFNNFATSYFYEIATP